MGTDRQETKKASTIGSAGHLQRPILEAAASLFPGYFALVMATGVVSIACHLMGMHAIALCLVVVNWIAYPALWGLTIFRALRFRELLLRDISDHQRAPGFFTIVAGTCVLGTQNMIVTGAIEIATALWWLGLLLWFVVMYTFFTAVTVRQRKPTLARGINGAWLIAAVSTQSVVVLRGVINVAGPPSEAVQFQVIAMFLIGCMLYLAIIPLIFYRLTFVPLSREDFSPPYWINMGAVAITTLAGSVLLLRRETWPVLADFVPFLRGFTLFFWAAASWWIPFLFALTLWRYLIRRDALVYEPTFWGMVFPLGMYTTGTLQLSRALDLPFVATIPRYFIVLAILAWLGTFGGLVCRLLGVLAAALRGDGLADATGRQA